MKHITSNIIESYRLYLLNEEKSDATVKKYLRDVSEFKKWLDNEELSKEQVLKYKALLSSKSAVSSVNSIISSINSFFAFINRNEFNVKTIKTHKNIFSSVEKELTKAEYERLLSAASEKNDTRLYLLMQCI